MGQKVVKIMHERVEDREGYPSGPCRGPVARVGQPEAAAMGRRGHAAVFEHYNWDTEYQKLRAFGEQLLPSGRTDCS